MNVFVNVYSHMIMIINSGAIIIIFFYYKEMKEKDGKLDRVGER